MTSRHGRQCRRSRHHFGVATWPVGDWCRDMRLMSRRRLVDQEVTTWIDVATWPVELGVATSSEVATWLVQPGGGSDVVTSSEVATWGRLPGAVHCFVHCSSHYLDTVHGHCS